MSGAPWMALAVAIASSALAIPPEIAPLVPQPGVPTSRCTPCDSMPRPELLGGRKCEEALIRIRRPIVDELVVVRLPDRLTFVDSSSLEAYHCRPTCPVPAAPPNDPRIAQRREWCVNISTSMGQAPAVKLAVKLKEVLGIEVGNQFNMNLSSTGTTCSESIATHPFAAPQHQCWSSHALLFRRESAAKGFLVTADWGYDWRTTTSAPDAFGSTTFCGDVTASVTGDAERHMGWLVRYAPIDCAGCEGQIPNCEPLQPSDPWNGLRSTACTPNMSECTPSAPPTGYRCPANCPR